MNVELPVRFDCLGHALYGVLHRPAAAHMRGVVLVVGGPQYRVGSHRQFVLLARALAAGGVAVLRFDYRGMGDSEGEARTFEDVYPDIRAAGDELVRQVPEVREIILWGLCDAASAVMQYAPSDARVTGVVLLNPWVRTEAGLAQAYLKHYYVRRILDINFWSRLIRGEMRVVAAVGSFWLNLRRGIRSRGSAPASATGAPAPPPLPERMLDSLRRYRGRVLLLLSGDDIIAGEFKSLVAHSARWRRALAARGTVRHDLPGANHTFAARAWRDQVAVWTRDWIQSP